MIKPIPVQENSSQPTTLFPVAEKRATDQKIEAVKPLEIIIRMESEKKKEEKGSNWPWTRIAKYAAGSAVALGAIYYGWPLIKTLPNMADTVKEGADAAKQTFNTVFGGAAKGVGGIRTVLNQAGIHTPPPSQTPAEGLADVAKFAGTAYVAEKLFSGTSPVGAAATVAAAVYTVKPDVVESAVETVTDLIDNHKEAAAAAANAFKNAAKKDANEMYEFGKSVAGSSSTPPPEAIGTYAYKALKFGLVFFGIRKCAQIGPVSRADIAGVAAAGAVTVGPTVTSFVAEKVQNAWAAAASFGSETTSKVAKTFSNHKTTLGIGSALLVGGYLAMRLAVNRIVGGLSTI